MCLYLHNKLQNSNLVLTSFREGVVLSPSLDTQTHTHLKTNSWKDQPDKGEAICPCFSFEIL